MYRITVNKKPLKGAIYNDLDWSQAVEIMRAVQLNPLLHKYKVIHIERYNNTTSDRRTTEQPKGLPEKRKHTY